MKPLLLSVLATAALHLTAAAQDLKRDLEAFTALAVNTGLDVTIMKADRYALEVTGDAAALAELKIDSKPGTFGIGFEDNASRRLSGAQMNSVRATVYTKTLDRVVANGGAEVRSPDTWSADDFKVVTNGGAELAIAVDADAVDLLANGGSEIKIEGRADRLKVNANGGSEVNAAGLAAERVDVMANGGSGVRVTAAENLRVMANGSADVTYGGAVTEVDVRSNGGSSITRQ